MAKRPRADRLRDSNTHIPFGNDKQKNRRESKLAPVDFLLSRCLATLVFRLLAAAAEAPLTNGAYVDVDELADRVVAHAAFVEAEGYVAEMAGADAGDADVDGLGLHVLRVFGDAGDRGAGAEEVIGPGRAVAADDVDDFVGAAEGGQQGVQKVELADVVVADVLGAMVAQEVVQLGDGAGNVLIADPVDDVDVFARMEVVEFEFVTRGGVGLRGSGGNGCPR